MTATAPTPTPETGPAEGVRSALGRELADVILEGGAISPRHLAARLVALPEVAKLLAAEAARVAAVERAGRAEGALTTERTHRLMAERAAERWMRDCREAQDQAVRLGDDLNALAAMYGEACGELARLHLALEWDDVAFGMYTARRDRERREAAESNADALRRENAALRAALEAEAMAARQAEKTAKHFLDVRTRQMRQSNDLWCRLAEQALRGDASALRTRIEAHRNPDRSGACIVRSDALAHRPAPAAGPGPTEQDQGGNGHGR